MSAPDAAPRADAEGVLACPFCGGDCDPEGWLGTEEDPVTGDALRRGPECNECGATAMSVEEWNRRTPPDALRDAVIAAAQAWKQARRPASGASWLEVVGAATRLERAVDAYEAALPGGRG